MKNLNNGAVLFEVIGTLKKYIPDHASNKYPGCSPYFEPYVSWIFFDELYKMPNQIFFAYKRGDIEDAINTGYNPNIVIDRLATRYRQLIETLKDVKPEEVDSWIERGIDLIAQLANE